MSLPSSFAAGQPIEGGGRELFAITAVVVGGTLLTGGVGSVGATLSGVLLPGRIFDIRNFENGLGTVRLSAYWQSVIRGAFLLFVVILQSRMAAPPTGLKIRSRSPRRAMRWNAAVTWRGPPRSTCAKLSRSPATRHRRPRSRAPPATSPGCWPSVANASRRSTCSLPSTAGSPTASPRRVLLAGQIARDTGRIEVPG